MTSSVYPNGFRTWASVRPGPLRSPLPQPLLLARRWPQHHRRHLFSSQLTKPCSETAVHASSSPASTTAPEQSSSTVIAEQQQQQQGPKAVGVAAGKAAAVDVHWRDVWRLLQPDWPLLAACTACALISVTCNVLVAPTMGRVIDVIGRGTLARPQELTVAVATLGSVYVGSNVTLAAQVSLSLAIAESLAARLRSELFRRLLGRDAVFFDSVKTGQMVSWLGQDVEVLQSTIAKLLGARGVRSAFETVGIIVMLFALSPLLAATLLVSAPLLTPLIVRLAERIGGASKTAQGAVDDISAAADEVIENIKIVKLFGAEQRELGRFRGLVDKAHALSTQVIGLQGLLDISSRARNTLCVLSTLTLGTCLAMAGRVTLGTCYSFFIFAFSFAFSLGNLANTSGDLARAAGAAARALAAMRQAGGELPMQNAEGAADGAAASSTGAAQLGAAAAGQGSSSGSGTLREIPADQFRGEVEFRGVSFRHPGWEGWTLDDISFTVPAGSTVALVGPSGGGKSTLASLVMGLYSQQEGSILVDGVPLDQLDMGWWRRQLGVVMQDAGLLTGRVRDIIRYGRPDADQAAVEAAARTAQAHDFITSLPAGYDTMIGAEGVELSGGQRQRLAIARALLVRPSVLLLDEATSALDVETEAAVAEALHEAGREATTLVIAHRLSTVRRADRIVVVAGGRVAEFGTHEQLLARPGGIYQRLVAKAQRKGRDSWESDDAASSSEGEGESDAESEVGAAGRAEALAAAP